MKRNWIQAIAAASLGISGSASGNPPMTLACG